MARRRPVAQHAFTLVELLVVLAIIAVLMSLLLPALSRAQAHARFVSCASNIRQVLAAHLMYGNDFKDAKPPLIVVKDGRVLSAVWVSPAVRQNFEPTGQGLLIDRYLKSLEPLLDPSEGMTEDAQHDRETFRDPLASLSGSSYLYFWQHPADVVDISAGGLIRGATRQRQRAKGRHAVLMDANSEYARMYGGVLSTVSLTAHPRVKRVNVGYLDGSVQSFPSREFVLAFPGHMIDSLKWFDEAHRRYGRGR